MSKIVIDAGHGKNTADKRCLKSLDQNETREWVLNDRVADALETYLLSAGHATGASQIIGMALVTTVINSILTVRNPAGNATALTITPLAGGTRPVSAHLVIIQLQ